MNDEQKDERWAPEADEDAKAHRSRYAEIKRRERLDGAVKNVLLTYQLLAHRAGEGTEAQKEFDRKWKEYAQVKKKVASLSRKEQDLILEEYPRLVARLEEEHGL